MIEVVKSGSEGRFVKVRGSLAAQPTLSMMIMEKTAGVVVIVVE